jgi:hypothetical protein
MISVPPEAVDSIIILISDENQIVLPDFLEIGYVLRGITRGLYM